MKTFVLIIQKNPSSEQLDSLKELSNKGDFEFKWAEDAEEALPYIEKATVIHGTSARLIPLAANLKWFSSASAGVNSYLPLIREETILTNSAGAFGLSIAEHIIMVLLMMLREMPAYQKEIKNHGWKKDIMLESIFGKRITVVGTGDIGSNFAQRIRAFLPAALIGVSRSGNQKDCFDKCVRMAELDSLLPATDVLVSCVPETRETVNYLNRKRLQSLPAGSYLINVGRGSAVDEEALYDALKSGHLKAAALDVFRKEPLDPGSPLHELDNLIITPHISGNLTVDYTIKKNFDMFLENLRRYISNEALEHVVDKEREY